MTFSRSLSLVAASFLTACVCWSAPALALEPTPAPAPTPAVKPAETPKSTEPAKTDAPKPATDTMEKPAVPTATDTKTAYVKFSTTLGDIVIELNAEKAPLSASNFLAYVDQKFYDGTIFHRVIPGFMIQGGGFTPEMTQKSTNTPIKNEGTNGLKNLRGTLSMARTSDLNSATSQFFLNVVDNAFLDNPSGPYAVFGKVVSGMDVADKIVAVKTAKKGNHENVPVEPVKVTSAVRISAEEAAKATKK